MVTLTTTSSELRTEQITGLIGDPIRDWEHSPALQALWARRGGRAAFEAFAVGQCDGPYGFDPMAQVRDATTSA